MSERPTIARVDRFSRLVGEVQRAAGTVPRVQPILAVYFRDGGFNAVLTSGCHTWVGHDPHPAGALDGLLQVIDDWAAERARVSHD